MGSHMGIHVGTHMGVHISKTHMNLSGFPCVLAENSYKWAIHVGVHIENFFPDLEEIPERMEEVQATGKVQLRQNFSLMQRSWLGKRKLQETDMCEQNRGTRKAAFKWLKGTEHILRLYGHDGWNAFLPRPCLPGGKWPYIAVSLDQGSDGFAAMHFLLHKVGVNADMVPDPSHQWHRDVQNTWSALGWGSWTRLLVIPINLFHGPFTAGARYHEFREASAEMIELMRMGDNSFVLEYAKELKSELGLSGGPLQAGEQEQIVEGIAERLAHQRRGSRVAHCRFGSLLDSLDHLCQNWTVFLLQTLHVMSDDKFKLKDLQSMFAKSREKTPETDARASTTDEVKKMRDLCSSNVAITCALLGDFEGRAKASVIRVFTKETRRWYGSQSTKLRSLRDAREWFVVQGGRGLLQPLLQTLQLLRDVPSLEECGLAVDVEGPWPDLDDYRVENERTVARTIGEYTLCLLRERIKRLTWFSHGDLSLVARLAGPVEGDRNKAAK
eukprot:6491738-Amphidinium_carterae.4